MYTEEVGNYLKRQARCQREEKAWGPGEAWGRGLRRSESFSWVPLLGCELGWKAALKIGMGERVLGSQGKA